MRIENETAMMGWTPNTLYVVFKVERDSEKVKSNAIKTQRKPTKGGC